MKKLQRLLLYFNFKTNKTTMGIDGLLPLLKSIAVSTHLSELRGQRAAVDSYSWLHRGTYGCATDLCLKDQTEVDGYIDFCLRIVDLLRNFGIIPIMVMDGAPLECKKNVEEARAASRQVHLERGKELHAQGNTSDAYKSFSKAIDVTPEMAKRLIDILKERNIECIVAPHEADAQLKYLEQIGKVDFIVTEDSDLLAFGATRVLYKLNHSTGMGQMIDSRRLSSVEELNFVHFNSDMFLDMCILCGCDYLDSVDGIGPKRAHVLTQKYRTTDRILRGLRFEDRSLTIPIDYEIKFYKARLSFRHQRVFCPQKNCLVHLNPITQDILTLVDKIGIHRDLLFLGTHLSDEVAVGVANAVLHPVTYQPWVKVFSGLTSSKLVDENLHNSSSLMEFISNEKSSGSTSMSTSNPWMQFSSTATTNSSNSSTLNQGVSFKKRLPPIPPRRPCSCGDGTTTTMATYCNCETSSKKSKFFASSITSKTSELPSSSTTTTSTSMHSLHHNKSNEKIGSPPTTIVDGNIKENIMASMLATLPATAAATTTTITKPNSNSKITSSSMSSSKNSTTTPSILFSPSPSSSCKKKKSTTPNKSPNSHHHYKRSNTIITTSSNNSSSSPGNKINHKSTSSLSKLTAFVYDGDDD
jgi:5'-3' exonuclease